MSLTISSAEADLDRWVRVKCGQTTLHECPFGAAMHFEGNNYYPFGSRMRQELFFPSELQWSHPRMGTASFFSLTKPENGAVVKDVMWQHPNPSPGYEFLTLYVGYDMNKTFVSAYDHSQPGEATSASTSSHPTAGPPLVDGTSSTPSASTSSSRRASGSAGGSSAGSTRGGGRQGSRRTTAEEEEESGDDGEGSMSGISGAGGVERSVTNRDVPVRRASLGGRGRGG